ncbi:MAG TPA: peptidylprolyl isomerase [Bacteroidota bacterium]
MTFRSMLLLLCLTVAGSRALPQSAERQTRASVHDPASKSAVVARVGPIDITAREFLFSYEFAPAYIKQRKDAKEHLLNLMINEKLFALENNDAVSRARIASALEEVEGDLATEELYKREVLPRVRIRPSEVRRGVKEAGIQMQVQWLYAADAPARDSLSASLRQGTGFDRMFAAQAPDSAARLNRTMNGTLFDIRKRNAAIGAVLAGLSPGNVSPPVQGPDGWYFVRIREEWLSALQSETEQITIRHDVEAVLRQQKADSISNRYILDLMGRHRPVIEKESFPLVLSFLAQYFADSADAAAWGWLPPRASRGPWTDRDTRWILAEAGRPLVTLRGGRDTLRLGSFLSWYRNRETLIKLPARNQARFFYEAEQLVFHMVRDRLLVERARERKLTELESVRVQKKWWEEKLLFETGKSNLLHGIAWSDEALRSYYRQHKRDFRDGRGDTLGFEAARDDVLRSYYGLETAKLMYRQVALLRRKYPVEIRMAALARIPVEEQQAKPIDLYAVKKGGTFPRPAFPTVDPGWREWY